MLTINLPIKSGAGVYFRACLGSGEVPDFRVLQRQFSADVLYVPQGKLPKQGAKRRVKTVLRRILNRLLLCGAEMARLR